MAASTLVGLTFLLGRPGCPGGAACIWVGIALSAIPAYFTYRLYNKASNDRQLVATKMVLAGYVVANVLLLTLANVFIFGHSGPYQRNLEAGVNVSVLGFQIGGLLIGLCCIYMGMGRLFVRRNITWGLFFAGIIAVILSLATPGLYNWVYSTHVSPGYFH